MRSSFFHANDANVNKFQGNRVFYVFNAFRCMNFEKILKNDETRNFMSIPILKWVWKWKK